MDKNLKNLIEAINSDKERGVSNARSIKRHLVELEAVLDSGIPLKKFVEDLKASGFKCTYRTVQNILYWYRKDRKLNGSNSIITRPVQVNHPVEIETEISATKTENTMDDSLENLTLKQRAERKTNELFERHQNDIANNPIIKKYLKEQEKKNQDNNQDESKTEIKTEEMPKQNYQPPARRKTLKEVSAEVDKMLAENKRPLY